MRARSLAPILPRLGMADMLTCATTLFGLCRRRDVSYGLEGRLHCDLRIRFSVERALRNTVLTALWPCAGSSVWRPCATEMVPVPVLVLVPNR